MNVSDYACEPSENVAILGAGPAGLACGWAMEEAGLTDYSIFEKSTPIESTPIPGEQNTLWFEAHIW